MRSLREFFQARMSRQPAAAAAREVRAIIVDGQRIAGHERTYDPATEMYRRFRIEQGRYAAYRDAHVAKEESPILSPALCSLAEDCTAEAFTVKCSDRRAADEISEVLKRVGYWGQKRTGILQRLILTGDYFNLVDIDWQPKRKRNLAEIRGLRMAPEFTMIRLTDSRGVFPNWKRAFVQKPGIDLQPRMTGIEYVTIGERLVPIDTSAAFYSGLAGAAAGREFWDDGKASIFFSVEEVIHSRLRPGWQTNPSGYGTGILNNGGVRIHNILMGETQDLAIARQGSSFNRNVFSAEAAVSDDSLEKLRKHIQETKLTSAAQYVVKGMKATALDARNWQLQKLDDLWFFVDCFGFIIGYPMALAGFGAPRFSGDLLERMEQRFKRTIAFYNQLEEFEIVRPVIDRQMWYSGKGDVDYEIEFPPVSFEDANKRTKRELSKVQGGTASRRTAIVRLEGSTLEEAEAELTQIEAEQRRLGPVTKYRPPGESLDKGGKGVEKKPPEVQDITDTEGTGG